LPLGGERRIAPGAAGIPGDIVRRQVYRRPCRCIAGNGIPRLECPPHGQPARRRRQEWSGARSWWRSPGIAGWFWPDASRSERRDAAAPVPERAPVDPARELAQRLLLVDTHIDLPYRMRELGGGDDDVARRLARGDFDAVRAQEGGLDIAWMSIYVPARLQKEGGAKAYADRQIDLVRGIALKNPRQFVVPETADQAEEIVRSGRIALPMGMENGAGIESSLGNLAHFHRRGIRYITLTHGEDNLIADSSYSDPAARRWHGLSKFGGEVVAEMNRLGILIDLSRVSDEAFDERSTDPGAADPLAQLRHHSRLRAQPGRRGSGLGEEGRRDQISFGSAFLTAAANA
jgi:membrane dipeptidase